MVTVLYTKVCDFTIFIVLKQMYFIHLVLKMYTFEIIIPYQVFTKIILYTYE